MVHQSPVRVTEIPRCEKIFDISKLSPLEEGPLGTYEIDPNTRLFLNEKNDTRELGRGHWTIPDGGEHLSLDERALRGEHVLSAGEWRAIFFGKRGFLLSNGDRTVSEHNVQPLLHPSRMTFSDALDGLTNAVEVENISLDSVRNGRTLTMLRSEKDANDRRISVCVARTEGKKADEAMGLLLWHLAKDTTKLGAPEHGVVRDLLRAWVEYR